MAVAFQFVRALQVVHCCVAVILLKFCSSTQQVISGSSGELEQGSKQEVFCLEASRHSEELVLVFDATAAKAMLGRCGHVKAKNIACCCLATTEDSRWGHYIEQMWRKCEPFRSGNQTPTSENPRASWNLLIEVFVLILRAWEPVTCVSSCAAHVS